MIIFVTAAIGDCEFGNAAALSQEGDGCRKSHVNGCIPSANGEGKVHRLAMEHSQIPMLTGRVMLARWKGFLNEWK